jgi:signal transduction histidine kinase
MSLTIREKVLLAAGLIIIILVAPSVYSTLMLRRISALAATAAGADARTGALAARLGGLFSEASRSARLLQIDPDFQSGFEDKMDEIHQILAALARNAESPLPSVARRAASALREFRAEALSDSADERSLDRTESAVRRSFTQITLAVQRLGARRTADAERLAQQAATLTMIATVVGLLVAVVLWASLVRSLGRPLRDLVEGTERIARGRFDEKIPVRAGDELGRLAGAFNRMAGALGDLDRMKAEFLSAASHGLRTPLACAKGYLSRLASGRRGPMDEESQRTIRRADEELDRVSRFVEQLLDLGRIRSGGLEMSMRGLPAAAFFTNIGRSFEALAEERKIRYQIRVEEGIPARITADPDRLGEALINLLDNAFKYTPSEGVVDLTVTGETGWVQVEVADNGPGIPPEEAPWIFEKYYRGGGVSAEGSGLGLAIARGIIERHGGTIWMEDDGRPGARFVFKVPERPPDQAEARTP